MFTKSHIELIDIIYDCMLKPDLWTNLLDGLNREFELVASNIFMGDNVENELNAYFLSSNLLPLANEYFYKGYADIDYSLFKNVPDVQNELEFLFEHELIEHINNQYYYNDSKYNDLQNWCRSNFGMVSRGAYLLNAKPNYWAFLTLHFAHLPNEKSLYALSIMDSIVPHIARALSINRPFVLLEKKYKAVLEVLDKLQLGVLIFDENGINAIKNRAADEILGSTDLISISKCGTVVFNGKNRIKASEIVHKLNSRVYSPKVTSFVLKRTNIQHTLIVEVCKIGDDDLGSSRYYMCKITNPDNAKIIEINGLAKLYHFTKTEIQVAQMVINGLTNSEIAESRSVSTETVKSQVASILKKVNCRNRIDLVQLCHSINIPIS